MKRISCQKGVIQSYTNHCNLKTRMMRNNDQVTATKEELRWALRVKEAAQDHAGIDASIVSDLEFWQFALIAKGDVNKALSRLVQFQCFKAEYGIVIPNGSMEQGLRDLDTFQSAHPRFFLSLAAIQFRCDNDDDTVDPTHLTTTNLAHCFPA